MIAMKHLNTVLTHKKWVFFFARKLDIGWQGFWHDMSKLSPTEFLESVEYYTGTRSPIDACKEVNGYSMAWLHHKGRNPHHYEYWQDNFDNGGTPLKMPRKYFTELVCDWLAAGRAYRGEDFHFTSEWEWWLNKRKNPLAMHPQNRDAVNEVLLKLHERFGTKKLGDFNEYDWKRFKKTVNSVLDKYY